MKASPVFGLVTVAAAGTPVVLGADSADTRFNSIVIQAKDANAGKVFIQASNAASTSRISLAAGEKITIAVPTQKDFLTLGQFYIDAATNGDGITYCYIKS